MSPAIILLLYAVFYDYAASWAAIYARHSAKIFLAFLRHAVYAIATMITFICDYLLRCLRHMAITRDAAVTR